MGDAPPTIDATAAADSGDLDAKVRLARNVVASLERAIRSRKLYAADHPLRQGASDEVHHRFREFFDTYAYMRLEITATELKIEGRVVVTCEPRESEIPFRLFKDGLRELRFQRGMERNELVAFLSVLEMDLRQMAELEQDVVSLLWSKDLQTIDYVAVDEFQVAEDGGDLAADYDADLQGAAQTVLAGIDRMLRAVQARDLKEARAALAVNEGGRGGSGTGGGRGPASGSDSGPGTGSGGGTGVGSGGGTGVGHDGGYGKGSDGGVGTGRAGGSGVGTQGGTRSGGTPLVQKGGGGGTPGDGSLRGQHAASEAVELKAEAPASSDSPKPAPAASMSAEQVSAIFAVAIDPVCKNTRENVDSETLGGTIRRSMDLLIKMFNEDGKVTINDVGPLLRGVVGFYSRKGEFADVGHLLSRLKESHFLDRIAGGSVLWMQLLQDAHSADVRKNLLSYLNTSFAGDYEGLRRYLGQAGGVLVNEICAMYTKVVSQKSRRALRDYLADHGKNSPLAFKVMLASADKLVGEVLEVIRDVKPVGFMLERELKWAELATPVKVQVLSIGASLEGTARARILKLGLVEEDPYVRGIALRAIADSKAEELGFVLQTWIDDKSFASREAEEKQLTYRAFGRIGGAVALRHFREVLGRKLPMFDRQRALDTRRAAILGLREIGMPDAQELLRALAASSDDTMRKTAEEALRGGK
jgi:hypothetical protein